MKRNNASIRSTVGALFDLKQSIGALDAVREQAIRQGATLVACGIMEEIRRLKRILSDIQRQEGSIK
jgi:hypothetical protein